MVGYIPFVAELSSLLKLAHGDPAGARAIFLESSPGWIDPDQWGQLIDANPSAACVMAWTLGHTGDEVLGSALLQKSLAYVEELPSYIEHADNQNIDICYLAAGENEKALEIIESKLAHNHLFWWNTFHQLPMYELVRHEPRYQAIQAEVDRRLAEQREAVAQMNLETGP